MEELYQNKYRVKSTRLPGWDYISSGFYFVTICTKKRICNLGEVLMDNNHEYFAALSEIGKIARDCWLDIPNHFPNASLDEWVIMPNHMHGIVVIGANDANVHGRDAINRVSTGGNKRVGGITGKHNPMLRVTLGTMIRWFKGRTSFECHKRNFDFHWQSRFYDQIIRNELVLHKIRAYIKNNPKMWYRDRNNTEGMFM